MYNSPEKPRGNGLRTHKTHGPLHKERNYLNPIHRDNEVKQSCLTQKNCRW